jgi:hypothetical protein
MQNVSYTKDLASGGLKLVVVIVVAMLGVAVLVLLLGIGPKFLGWLILAIGTFLGTSLVWSVLGPTVNQIRIVTDEQILSIQVPGGRTGIIPIGRISQIVGIAHEWGLAHGGDEVDFEIHWDGKKLRVPEEILIQSGLRKFLSELPEFDNNVLQQAQLAALHGRVPLWGKRYVLLRRPSLKT